MENSPVGKATGANSTNMSMVSTIRELKPWKIVQWVVQR